jgi:hypothetical protein
VMQVFGHSGSQAPQLMHSSVIFRAIFSTPCASAHVWKVDGVIGRTRPWCQEGRPRKYAKKLRKFWSRPVRFSSGDQAGVRRKVAGSLTMP